MRVSTMVGLMLLSGAALAQTPAQSQSGPPAQETGPRGTAPSQGGTQPGATVSDPHKENLLKEIDKYATPDAHHKALEPLIGKWDTRAKLWMGEAHAETASGHAVVQSILSGRFVEEHYDSVVWGKPFAAQGLIGFDEHAQQYTIGWVDSWSTWITVAQGTADVTSHVITMSSKDYDTPAPKTRPVKFVFTIESNDKHTRRVYEKVNGKETLTMEIEYRRKK